MTATPADKVSRRIEFERSLMERYDALNPNNSLWHNMNRLLEEFVKQCEAEKPGPLKHKLAAGEVAKRGF